LTSVASALSSAALIEAQGGHPERTATIAGALDAMTESSRVAIAQVDMLGLPTSADEARSRLDPEAFERAYQLGRTMDRSAIIAFTMAGPFRARGRAGRLIQRIPSPGQGTDVSWMAASIADELAEKAAAIVRGCALTMDS